MSRTAFRDAQDADAVARETQAVRARARNPRLAELVADPAVFQGSAELRIEAATALGRIGVADAAVLDALRSASRADDALLRNTSREALERVGVPAAEDAGVGSGTAP